MGDVYLAQDRRIASQRSRSNLSGAAWIRRTIVRRFQHEQQFLLASLNHPNIAQLYDGGITADGIPFFAMEYVEGTRSTITAARRSCRSNRLELFRKICAAVHYAHQHLVVHRDIKPSNILRHRRGRTEAARLRHRQAARSRSRARFCAYRHGDEGIDTGISESRTAEGGECSQLRPTSTR